jgi:class 3 adenylate cyclase/tetratricopeptide (TPR) repeat protein
MHCPSCGHDNREGSRFCAECGASLQAPRFCPDCGAEAEPGQKFCTSCGRRLTTAPAAQAAPARAPADAAQPTPIPSPPQHLADRLRAAGPAAIGERKQVTVMFADVKGSMDMAAAVDPEDWRGIMQRLVRILAEGVHRFEGTVDKFTGDGIMALFGAPLAQEDHAQRACYAALHLRDRVSEFASDLRRSDGLSMSLRIGLNSGEVIVGTIGEDLELDYTAVGHTVGLAQRMESLAEPGKVFLTEHTAALVRGWFDFTELGRFDIKGVPDRLDVFELCGVGAARTRLDAAATRGLSRFVGRDDEMATLEQALARAAAGRGQAVGIVAEPGVGKSRLCREFVERCRDRGIDVWETRALAYGTAVPLLPVLEFLRNYFGIVESDDERTARDKIAGRLLLLDESFRDALPLLFEFLGVPDPERPPPRIDPEARQRQLFATLDRLLHARSDEQPAVILVEDLHWVDRGSEAFFQNLVDGLPGARTLVVSNFRPEYEAGWLQRRSYYVQVPLQPLGAEAVGELLRDLLGDDPSLDGLAEVVRERTGGNPFFVEEVVQGLVESGSLEGEPGAYRLAIPATVQSVLAARIDHLGEREKSVLQTAAVVGREFTEPVLARIVDLTDDELRGTLRNLVDAEFVYQQSMYPEPEYAFKHALTEEVAYRSQLTDARAAVHAEVARAIEQAYPERQDELAALLAHHCEQAGDCLQAARWCSRAAGWAGYNDPFQAQRHWHRARGFLAGLEPEDEVLGLSFATCLMLLSFGWRLGIREGQTAEAFEEEMASLYEEGRGIADRMGNGQMQATVAGMYGAVMTVTAQLKRSLELGREATNLARRLEDPVLVAVTAPTEVYALNAMGQRTKSREVAEAILAEVGGDVTLGAGIGGLPYPVLWLQMMAAAVRAQTGEVEPNLRELERIVRRAHELGDVEVAAWSHMNLADQHALVGDRDAALAHARAGLELAERTGGAFTRGFAYTFLGEAHLFREEWDQALEAFDRYLAVSDERHVGIEIEPYARACRARALMFRGELAAAVGEASTAVALGVARQTRHFEAMARSAYGLARLARDGAAAAARAVEEHERALAFEDEAMRTLRPLFLVGLRDALAAAGDSDRAAEVEAEARAEYEAMGATDRAHALPVALATG